MQAPTGRAPIRRSCCAPPSCPRPQARAAWQALRPRVDLARLDRASLRLLPLLDANLRRHGIDDPLGDALALAREQAAARNRTLFQGGRRLLATLADAGIDTLMLKGGALAATVYGDPGLRPMSDLDVLVPTARARAAIDALERQGWAPRIAITPGFIRTQHAADMVAEGAAAKCDLHWHAYWECCQPDADTDLWAASTALDFEGVPTRALAPADQLLHVCVNGSRRARRPNLLWIPDALRLVEAGGIDWSRLLAQAAARRFSLRARTMLGYLRRAFDARVPDEALEGLGAVRVSGLERLEFRIGNRPAGPAGRAAELLVQLPPPRRRDGDAAAPRLSLLPAADVEGADPRRDRARRARARGAAAAGGVPAARRALSGFRARGRGRAAVPAAPPPPRSRA